MKVIVPISTFLSHNHDSRFCVIALKLPVIISAVITNGNVAVIINGIILGCTLKNTKNIAMPKIKQGFFAVCVGGLVSGQLTTAPDVVV